MRSPWFHRVAIVVLSACVAALMVVRTAPALAVNLLAVRLSHQLVACGFSLLDFRGDQCRVEVSVEPAMTPICTILSCGSPEVRRLELVSLLAAGDKLAVVQGAQSMLGKDPSDWRTRIVLAHAMELAGLKDQALAQWGLVGAGHAFQVLADSYRSAGCCDIALEYLDIAIGLEPQSGESYLSRGQCYKALGRIEEAERALRLAVSLSPSAVPPRIELAELLIRQGIASRRWEARVLLEDSLVLEPRSFVAYQLLGEVLSLEGDYAAEETLFRKMVDEFPNHQLPPMYLGQTYVSEGNYSLAEYWFRRSIDLNPEYAPSHYFLGLLYLNRADSSSQDLVLAITELEQAVRLTNATPNPNVAFLFALGQAYLEVGDRVSAARQFCEALRLQPDYAAARDYLMGTGYSQCVP